MSEITPPKNIYLVGFMGSGKTTIGKVLSRSSGKKFVDLDFEIASVCKSTITDIFKEKGEKFFRDTETKILKAVSSDKNNCVVSTGGGVVLKDINWELMNSSGIVVYLEADFDNIWDRIKYDSTRPLLNVDNAFGRTAELFNSRKKLYEKADVIIKTDGLTVDQTIHKIRDQLAI